MPHRKRLGPLWSLRILALLSVAVPLLLYSGLGVFRYLESKKIAEQRVSRSLRVAHEHATKVILGAEALQDRLFNAVNGQDAAVLRANEQALHQMLLAKVKDQRQIQSASIVGADGRVVATSRAFPAPPLDVSGSPAFQFHRQGRQGPYLSNPDATAQDN